MQVAVFLVVLIGFAALTIDLGAMYNTRTDLQRSVDAAALAAAAQLSDWSQGNPLELARQAARDYVERNPVMGHNLSIESSDITFGRAVYDETTGQYEFTATDVAPDAVFLRLRHTQNSPNGAVPLYFAKIFGKSTTEMTVQATAVMVPRDIAIVADLSGSQNDDSELRHYRITNINLYDVWDELPGGIDEIGTMWDPAELPPTWIEGDGSVPQAAGPAWGYFKRLGFGTTPVTAAYDPTTDAGTIRLAYNQNWSDAQLTDFLADQGYIAGEISAIMSRTYDTSGAYPYRVAVALGLAFWNSGIAGGLWQTRGATPGNANAWIASNEIEWTEQIFDNSVGASGSIWYDYINNYVKGSSSQMYAANSNFRYRFGIKTFINYLLEKRESSAETPELADTPSQPLEAVKDATDYMARLIDDLDTDDQLSLEVYATSARHEIDLTHDHQLVSQRLREMQPGHYDANTNIGGGLQSAIDELSGARARHGSKKMIVLLTDGLANVDSSGDAGDEEGGAAYAIDRAEFAASQGIIVFAVSVGAGADQSLMQQIAEIGNGEHFHAEGSVDQYSEQLRSIFIRLAGTRPVELIQ